MKTKEETITVILKEHRDIDDPIKTAHAIWNTAIDAAAENASTEYKPRSPIATVDKQSILKLKF